MHTVSHMMGSECTQEAAAVVSFYCGCVKQSFKMWSGIKHTPHTSRKSEKIKSHSSKKKHHTDTRWLWQPFHDVKLKFIDRIWTLFIFFLQRMKKKNPVCSVKVLCSLCSWFELLWSSLLESAIMHKQMQQTVVFPNTQTNVKVRKMHVILINLLIIYIIHITHA